MSITSKNIMRVIAVILLCITGISALAAGYSFMADPSGNAIGIPLEYLRYSPFSNFLIPGIILFTCNGVFSIATAIAVLVKLRSYPIFIIFQGCILVGWIIIQVMMVRDFNLLHFVILSVGILLCVIGKRLKHSTA